MSIRQDDSKGKEISNTYASILQGRQAFVLHTDLRSRSIGELLPIQALILKLHTDVVVRPIPTSHISPANP